jgi:hypothetical protein
VAYKERKAKEDAARKLEAERKEFDIDCPYCGKWADHKFIDEDSIVRGGI